MTMFIAIVLTAFFARVKPVSTSAKPACMNITRNPPTRTQSRLRASVKGATSPLSRGGRWNRYVRGQVAQPHERAEADQERDDGARKDQAAHRARPSLRPRPLLF